MLLGFSQSAGTNLEDMLQLWIRVLMQQQQQQQQQQQHFMIIDLDSIRDIET